MTTVAETHEPCPACGGAGGGPFGRAGGAWDDEAYVCPRCEGAGVVEVASPLSQRPGVVKAAPKPAIAPAAPAAPERRRAASDDEDR
jgi:hypothetical protein